MLVGLNRLCRVLALAIPRGHPSNSTDRQVGRQTKLLTHIAVAALMQIVLAMLLMLIAPISHKVAGLGKRFKRSPQGASLLGRNHQLARKGADRFHALNIVILSSLHNPLDFDRLKADKPPITD